MLDGVGYRLDPGHALLIFSHQFHHYVALESPAICWLFTTFELEIHEAMLPTRNRPLPVSKEYLSCLQSLVDLILAKPIQEPRIAARAQLLCGLLINELEATAGNAAPHTGGKPGTGRTGVALVERVNGLINARMDRPLSVSGLARSISLSASHLRCIYRKAMGMSIGAYWRTMRIHKAGELLGNSDLNVTQIAQACGFDSVFSFSRAFRTMRGVSPRQYRKMLREPTASFRS